MSKFIKDPDAVLDYKQDWATNTNQSKGEDCLQISTKG